MSLVPPDPSQQFAHILRLLNTNVDGKNKIMYALTEIKGVGRRYANIVCKKADVDLGKRWVSQSNWARTVPVEMNNSEEKIEMKLADWRERAGLQAEEGWELHQQQRKKKSCKPFKCKSGKNCQVQAWW